ncbi:MAG: hypothetical protein HC837_00405 [Chloroflexaceae bacterium]|nr:hypothetical protein [Chloroflexaceae bacterium]
MFSALRTQIGMSAEQERERERLAREQAEQQAKKAEQEHESERIAREQAEQQIARFIAQPRKLGIDPDEHS